MRRKLVNGEIAGPVSRSSWTRSSPRTPRDRGPASIGGRRNSGGTTKPGSVSVRAEVEGTAVHHDARDDRAMPADELGRRVDDDVRAVLDGPGHVGRGNGVVHDERYPGLMGDARDPRCPARCCAGCRWSRRRTAWCSAARRPARRRDHPDPRKGDLDPDLGQRVVEQVICPAIQRRARHQVVAGAGEGEHRQRLGCLAGGECHGRDPPFERGEAFFDDIARRVHDARVDVTRLGQAE